MGKHEEPSIAASITEQEISLLTQLMQGRTTIRLNSYKLPCVRRCVLRHMTAAGTGVFNDYAEILRQDAAELDSLISNITVEYSSFFRDPEVFDLVRESLLPQVVNARLARSSNLVRIWSAGSATGEEAYSISILMDELLSAIMERFTVMIFATDVDKTSTRKAIDGIYTSQSIENMDRARVGKYFHHKGGKYTVRKNIRKNVYFGVQDILDDPPISHLDLLLCRNVLIYLTRESQTHVLRKLHHALDPGGFLVLGKAETLTREVEPLFEVIDRQRKVYRKLAHA